MNDKLIQQTRTHAGVATRPSLWTIRVSGADAERFLNGMLSRDMGRLVVGAAAYAVKPNNKGKVQGILRVRRSKEAFHLDVEEAVAERVATELMKLVVADDVELTDETPERTVIGVYGPAAKTVLQTAGYSGLADLENLKCRDLPGVMIVRDDWLGLPGYELLVAVDTEDATLTALQDAGAARLSAEEIEVLRLEAGVPRDGVDVDDDTIALEARLEPIIDFDKGCYVGQETIARAHNLGGVQHLLVGLLFDGPAEPMELWADDKKVGELTSALYSPTVGRTIGLGYVRKANSAPGTEVRLGAMGGAAATVAALPFVAPS